MLTFQQFQALRTECADVAAAVGSDAWGNDDGDVQAGWTYTIDPRGALYIERCNDGRALAVLDLNNNGVVGTLEECERALYEWACDAGYVERDLQGAVPCGLNADWNSRAWHFGPSTERPNMAPGDVYVVDDESPDGTYTVFRDDGQDADENRVLVALGTFPHWDAAAAHARNVVRLAVLEAERAELEAAADIVDDDARSYGSSADTDAARDALEEWDDEHGAELARLRGEA